MHLVLAVTVRAQSAAHGVRETNAAVNVVEIFNAHVLPELQAPDLAARPIVKAGAIKYDPQLIKPPAGYRGADSMNYADAEVPSTASTEAENKA